MNQPDLMDVSYCAFSNLRRAARVVSHLYDDILKPTGLKTTQCMVLATIGRSGKSTVTELADAMTMDQTSMTRALNVLHKQGLVERIFDEADRRRRLITLTAKGEEILELAMELRAQAQTKMIEMLGDDNLLHSIELLRLMTTQAQR
ncbi:MAG: MarR family transcriptional regulator [Chloroflexota bacterium]